MTETTARAPRNTTGAIAKAAAGTAAKSAEHNTMQSYVTRMMPEIIKALPKHLDSERFVRMYFTALSSNPNLAKCSPASFLGAMMQSAHSGLEVNTVMQQAWLIPYYNNKERRYECQFQIGYQGLKDLAYRSGLIESIQVQTVRENDEFEYQLGLHPDIRHVPARGNRGAATDYYAIVNIKGGGYVFEVMSKADIDEHAKKYSKAGASGPWASAYDSMAMKTVLKRVLKLVPTSASLVKAMAADETIKTEISANMDEIAGTYIVDDDTGEVVAEMDAPEESEGGN